jgi:RNase P subunit RPR2
MAKEKGKILKETKKSKKDFRVFRNEKIISDIAELFENSPSKEQIKNARKRAMRVNLKLPIEIRRKFCHHCNALLKGRIRLRNGKRIIQCSECGKYTRIPYKP